MTREEVIALAQQAGWEMPAEWDADDGFLMRLGRFAVLVAAAEREACARVCEEEKNDKWIGDDAWEVATRCAELIRARGNDS